MIRQSRLASSKRPATLLSFAEYKARSTIETVGYNAASERPPLHSWYALDHENIMSGIHQACSSLLHLTSNCASDDIELANLHTALDKAKTVTHSKSICIAILGEQGTGKSSILCSALDRALVDISSSSSACTAFPTIITHKKGASDDTMESDVLIQYYNDEEIKECAEEQARRYRFAFPRKRQPGSSSCLFYDEYYDDDEEERLVESDTDREQILASGRTAKEFFNIIFDTDESRARKQELEHALNYDDIERGTFAATCVAYAKECLASIGAQGGFTKHDAVLDEDLADAREGAEELWPLVKSVRLATGHRLLRNNLSFLDLPGYGDDNQIRTAIVEKFREMADFEIVVVPTERVVSSLARNTYLTRSYKRLGAQKVLLVANKSDQLLNDLITRGVNKIKEPLFCEAKKRLKETEILARARTEPNHHINDYRRYVLKSPGAAFLKREEEIIRGKLRQKDCDNDIRLVSARQYSLCLEAPYGPEPPKITAEATGIPRLRQYLLQLPARMNYETLQYHVYETLPDIVSQLQRILDKFNEDAVYGEMRDDLGTWLPITRNSLRNSTELLVEHTVLQPWDEKAEQAILLSLKDIVQALVHPTPYYATFLKMIKEKGAPVNGKGKGWNFNNDILGTMDQHIQQWRDRMDGQIADLATRLEAPVQVVLRQLRTHLENMSDNPEHVLLKERASNAFETRTRRIGMAHEKLRTDLNDQLRATYAHYTTETHVRCPVALAMRPVYDSVLDVRGGPGAYHRHRQHLYECLCEPQAPDQNFAKVMATKITDTQKEVWTHCCEEYATEAMAQLEDFRRIADELLDSGGYVKADRREIRDQLRTLLPGFEEALIQIQKACPHLETSSAGPSDASVEVMELSDSDSLPPPAKRKR